VSTSEYLFENQAPQAGDRFDALASLLDPWTVAHLDRLGVAEGWRCLDVGAGGGSVARWLADRVEPSGHVLATDLDTRWLAQRLAAPNVEIRQHDVVADELPEGAFDLIHERLVLIHLRDRVEAIRRLAAAVRPGGWLLVEDFDSEVVSNAFIDSSDPDDTGRRIVRGIQTLLIERGADPGLGHKLPGLLRDAGLVDVGADGFQALDGNATVRMLLRVNIEQVGDHLVERGIIAREEIERYLTRIDDGDVNPSSPLMVSAWGRRPAD
jgi:SAM-dependent methyltransferase